MVDAVIPWGHGTGGRTVPALDKCWMGCGRQVDPSPEALGLCDQCREELLTREPPKIVTAPTEAEIPHRLEGRYVVEYPEGL